MKKQNILYYCRQQRNDSGDWGILFSFQWRVFDKVRDVVLTNVTMAKEPRGHRLFSHGVDFEERCMQLARYRAD